jgi:thiol:disulfide interchange protein DsbD
VSLLELWWGALAGGFLLNLFPCVLPVLGQKLHRLIDQGTLSPSVRRNHGLAYAAGTVALLAAYGAVVVVLRASGRTLGWGMHFQNPLFVAALVAVMFAAGLNALGLFELRIGMTRGGPSTGLAGSFVDGLLAGILATPCMAPMLGPATAFAMGSTAAAWQTLLLFSTIGFGLALPFVAVAYLPSMGAHVPKKGTGRFAERVKQSLGLAMLAGAAWYGRTLVSQLTRPSFVAYLGALVLLALVLGAGERLAPLTASDVRRRLVRALQWATIAGLAVGFGATAVRQSAPVATAAVVASDEASVKDGKIAWRPYSPDGVKALLARGRTVFVDFTADWCATCQANDAAFIETDTVRGALVRHGVVPVQADMTNDNAPADALLHELGRTGIPAYVVLRPDGTRDLLPEVVTSELVASRLAPR